MAALATTSVTSNSPASAASGSAGTPVSGDAFAAMLDALDQELASDVADPQSATDSDASTAAAATTPGSTASANASALDPMLAQLLAQQAVPSTPGAISPEPDDANKADPEAPGNEVAAAQAAQTSAPLPAPVDPKTIINAAAADPTKVDLETEAAADTRAKTDSSADTLAKADSSTDMSAMADTPSATDPNAPAKRNGALAGVAGRSAEHASSTGQRHRAQAWSALPDDHSHSDIPQAAPPGTPAVATALAASAPTTLPATLPAATQPVDPTAPDAPTAAPPVDPASSKARPATPDPASAALAAVANLPATSQAAPAIVASGTITKPGRPATAVSNDSSKSEGRNTRAAALADAGDVSRRGFASEPAVRTLPVQAKADDADNAASNGTQPPQHNAANPASIATPAQQPAAAPVQQTAATPAAALPHPAPQADPGVSIATVNSGASPTQAAAAAAPAHLAAQVQVTQHAPDINALAVNIAAKSEDGQKHFDIRLDPAELGRVDVRLTVDDAGKAQATLSVEKPQTLELLQKDQTHLERALKDAGLDLSQNGLSFSLKGQQQHTAQDHTPFARGQRLAAHAVAVQDILPPLSTSGVSVSDTRLDIRV